MCVPIKGTHFIRFSSYYCIRTGVPRLISIVSVQTRRLAIVKLYRNNIMLYRWTVIVAHTIEVQVKPYDFRQWRAQKSSMVAGQREWEEGGVKLLQ